VFQAKETESKLEQDWGSSLTSADLSHILSPPFHQWYNLLSPNLKYFFEKFP